MKNRYVVKKMWWKTKNRYGWTLFAENKVCLPLGFPTHQAALDFIPKLEEMNLKDIPYHEVSEGEINENEGNPKLD